MASTLVAGADAATFEILKLPGPKDFARDKNQVYLHGMLVSGAHPESFRKLDVPGGLSVPGGGNYYYRDSQRVFIYPYSLGGFIKMLVDSDPESFRVIGGGWSRDRTRVYLLSRWRGFGREIAKHIITVLAKFWEQTATLFISRNRNHGLPLIVTICSGTDG
jgi:hypothetical protein